MPKYYRDKITDHYLCFTAECIVEAMHIHASDKKLTEANSGKFFVKSDGRGCPAFVSRLSMA